MNLKWIKASELIDYTYVGLRSAPITEYIQPSIQEVGWQDQLSPPLSVCVKKKEIYDGISRVQSLVNLGLGLVALGCSPLIDPNKCYGCQRLSALHTCDPATRPCVGLLGRASLGPHRWVDGKCRACMLEKP